MQRKPRRPETNDVPSPAGRPWLSSDGGARARAGIAAPEPYEIGAILSLTGSAGFAGGEQKKALLALEALVNRTGGIGGRPLHIVVSDDTTNPQTSHRSMPPALT